MRRYDVYPAGVDGAIARTEAAADEFAGIQRRYQSALDMATAACGSAVVGEAVAGFAAHHADTVPMLQTRTGAAAIAARAATSAYVDGDDQMAANANRNAAAVDVPDMPRGTGRLL